MIEAGRKVMAKATRLADATRRVRAQLAFARSCAALLGLTALGAGPSPACAEPYLEKAAKELTALTPENVEARVTLKDDALEAAAMFTTERVYQEHRGLFGAVPADSFLRAFVDKQTGSVTWQIYSNVIYNGDWRFFEMANFQTSEGVQSVVVTDIDRQVLGCEGASGCLFSEDVGVELSDDVVRAIARLYNPGGPLAIWQFRLKARSGEDYTDGFAVAEVAGLVLTIDRWRTAHHPRAAIASPTSAQDGAPPFAAPGALGVSFVATPLGALIARVQPASKAAVGGILAGMMITHVNGTALGGLDLSRMQAALSKPGPRTLTIVGKGDIEIR